MSWSQKNLPLKGERLPLHGPGRSRGWSLPTPGPPTAARWVASCGMIVLSWCWVFCLGGTVVSWGAPPWGCCLPPPQAPNAAAQPRLKAGAQRTLYAVACMPLILIEAPSSAYHGGMLIVGNYHS
jgi:hypothetical protein